MEALPAPKSDSKSKLAPASSSPVARSDEEVGGGASEEVDDEAAARTGKVRAAARRSHFTQSRGWVADPVTGWVADPGDVSANSTCATVYAPAQEKCPGARPDESATSDPYEDPLPPVRAAPVRGGTALRVEQGAHWGGGLGECPRRGRS